MSKQVWLSTRESRNARHFNPSLLYVRADGEVIAPGRNDERQLPKSYLKQINKQGFRKVEINNFREYEKFQRDISQRLQSRANNYNSFEQRSYDEAIKQNIEFMKSGGMVEMPVILPNGKVSSRMVKMPKLEDLSPQGRRFAELAIKRAKEKRFRSENVNPMIRAMEFDNVGYEDREQGNWRKRYNG